MPFEPHFSRQRAQSTMIATMKLAATLKVRAVVATVVAGFSRRHRRILLL